MKKVLANFDKKIVNYSQHSQSSKHAFFNYPRKFNMRIKNEVETYSCLYYCFQRLCYEYVRVRSKKVKTGNNTCIAGDIVLLQQKIDVCINILFATFTHQNQYTVPFIDEVLQVVHLQLVV